MSNTFRVVEDQEEFEFPEVSVGKPITHNAVSSQGAPLVGALPESLKWFNLDPEKVKSPQQMLDCIYWLFKAKAFNFMCTGEVLSNPNTEPVDEIKNCFTLRRP